MFDIYEPKTPCYVISVAQLKQNLDILNKVKKLSGCKILLAQKAFSSFHVYPLLSKILDGTASSGLYEARLGYEEFGKETHVFSPAFTQSDMDELVKIADHIVFNSFSQLEKYREQILSCGRDIEIGLRVNPGYSEVTPEIYNPCVSGSRLGVPPEQFDANRLNGVDGLHFHALCEQGAQELERTLESFERLYARSLHRFKWLNFGGGHHITKDGYDIALLVKLIRHFQEKYGVQVYLEPGEAAALNAGWLVTTVLETGENGIALAITDASAACHMPDVLEMPYRPEIIGAGKPNEREYTYRLGGNTCLAGDIIGDYSFEKPLKAGDRLALCDMAIYTMVKNNTFNGMPLPSIYLENEDGTLELVREFGYEDFKSRV
ncbi:MAG: carboxynorspermidine decarboxylase [Ruminococcus sp.]|nr:carboxynorspermidine decarboxylase [Ruminococcus sp.]